MQVQREAVSDCLNKTATPEETALQVEARKSLHREKASWNILIDSWGSVAGCRL